MKKKHYIILIIILAAVVWILFRPDKKYKQNFQVQRESPEPQFTKEGSIYFLSYNTMDTLSVLDIEIVENSDDIMRGLMYRSRLKPDQGMFFIFSEEEEQSFWMKNTKISLDIIFINSDLRIVHISRHTIPYSKDPIPSMYPAKFVVEVNAGYCKRHQINPNDYIRYTTNELSLAIRD